MSKQRGDVSVSPGTLREGHKCFPWQKKGNEDTSVFPGKLRGTQVFSRAKSRGKSVFSGKLKGEFIVFQAFPLLCIKSFVNAMSVVTSNKVTLTLFLLRKPILKCFLRRYQEKKCYNRNSDMRSDRVIWDIKRLTVCFALLSVNTDNKYISELANKQFF